MVKLIFESQCVLKDIEKLTSHFYHDVIAELNKHQNIFVQHQVDLSLISPEELKSLLLQLVDENKSFFEKRRLINLLLNREEMGDYLELWLCIQAAIVTVISRVFPEQANVKVNYWRKLFTEFRLLYEIAS
ncbi:MAG: hypothetical protein HWE10_05985 [Gammaproteobacteria bacterium]|nr:hypothetical protein [Gammaproteobacteria bacterium]